jgi:tripartite-type tricarboxylate transporter receptor subunit TctC
VPTLKEQGIDVELVNWRAVFAPPGIKDKDLATLSATVEKMVKSASWQEVLKERSWLDLYQPHDQFVVSLKEEVRRQRPCSKSSAWRSRGRVLWPASSPATAGPRMPGSWRAAWWKPT